MIHLKNTAGQQWKYKSLEDGLSMLHHVGTEKIDLEIEIEEKVVQYYFCLEGSINFGFNQGAYNLPMGKGEHCFLYNPTQALNPVISLSENCSAVFVFSSLEKIHQMFLDSSEQLEFLKSENVNRKFYKKESFASDLEFVLRQIIQSKEENKTSEIFRYAKVLELLSLYFSQKSREDNVSCPYLQDETSIQKIKQAKDILLDKMQDPPTTTQLAIAVGINEHRLKEGFRSLYGSTLFQYLLDHKMNVGRNMLDTGKYKIKEVAYELGYNNPSHFITAFKNRFGLTPKKYLQN